MDKNLLEEKAKLVRKWSLISTTEAGSGHPTSCLSAADIATVIFDKYFTYDLENPLNSNNDRFVLSKGHAAPLLYTLFALSGGFPVEDLKTLRKFGSPLEGHPTPNFPYADAATGSLGQGLSAGAGMALVAKRENLPFKTYVMMGDGELAEGQVWEAANFASYYKLDNLIAIADVNRLGQSQETMFGHHVDEYIARFVAFGFEVLAIDGHNMFEVDKALEAAHKNTTGKPYIIIAKTFKGKGISFLEDSGSWHGKTVPKERLDDAIKELGTVDDSLRFSLRKPAADDSIDETKTPAIFFTPTESVATREVYGQVLAELGNSRPDIYALDAEVKNSSFSIDFLQAHPERFIECFIAEQNMVSVASGLSRLGRKPFVSTFGAFLVRAADQIRMAAVAKATISFCGSHAGVSIGEDGPSQMALEDISLFGTLPDSVIFHPSDAVSTTKIMPLLLHQSGISYLRTLRPKTPLLYAHDDTFEVGGSKVLKESSSDELTVVAAGITVHEALKAYELLQKDGVSIRVVDCYSIKPIDKDTLETSVEATKQPVIITVEDHFIHGGLGDFVLEAVSETGAKVYKLAVDHISRSGSKDDLLDDAGISAVHIVKKVRSILALS